MAEVNPYSQTANDPTTQLGLMQVLQQIQALQNQPLIPDNPLSQLGAALQGFSAGYAGQPNPAMQQALAQRQQQVTGLSQTAGILGHLNTIQHQQATLEETRRLRGLQEREYGLKEQIEARHAAAEVAKTQQDRDKRYTDVMVPLAKDWAGSKNTLVRFAGLDLQKSLLKKLGAQIPDAIFDALKSQTEDSEETRQSVAHAIAGGVPDDTIMRMYPGQTTEKLQIIKSLLRGSDDARTLWGLKPQAEMEKQKDEARKVRAEADKATLTLDNDRRIIHLTSLPTRTALQSQELLERQSLKGAPDLLLSMTLAIMRKEGLPLELAAPKAKELMAEASRQERDFSKVVAAIRGADPTLSEAESILAATQKMQASKKGFEEQELAIDSARGMLSRAIKYSGDINTKGPLGTFMAAPWRALKSWSGLDPDIEGMKRLAAELPGLLRQLGQKGILSDRDMLYGERLLPGIYATAAIRADSIQGIADILERAERNLTRMKAAARTIGPQPTPQPGSSTDPLNWRPRRQTGIGP